MIKIGSLIFLFTIIISTYQIKGKKVKDAKAIKLERNHESDKKTESDSLLIVNSDIKNIALLGKLWGFLKYYHPCVVKGNYNWDYELFKIIPNYCNSKNVAERNAIIDSWLSALGGHKIDTGAILLGKKVKISPDTSWFYNSKLDINSIKQLENLINAKRTEQYYVELNPSVGNPKFSKENAYVNMKYPDIGYRLLALFRYWNSIQYYYPYRNLIKKDWEKVLEEFIPRFIYCRNKFEYRLVILELITRIHDTHARIIDYSSVLEKHLGNNYAPIEIKFINDSAVITNFYDEQIGEEAHLKKGDIILKVNYKPVNEIVKRELKYTPASNYPTKLRNIASKLSRTRESTLTLTCKRNDKLFETKIKTHPKYQVNYRAIDVYKDTCFKYLSPGIAYLSLGSIKRKYIKQIVDSLKKTKGLIIDIRCYPSDYVVFDLGQYFIRKDKKIVKFTNGSLKYPGLFTFTDPLEIQKTDNYFYGGKIVVMVNEETQSSAEFHAMTFQASENVVVIGSATAGADGNVSYIDLPGGVRTVMSGIGVYYPDGKETQRIGIVPDIEVKPTIAGIREGRDEVLEKAIEFLNKK